MVNTRVFLDFSVNNDPIGRVIFELFDDSAPKASENFRSLCTGERGLSALSERPLYYKNTIVHRSIKGFMIQAGDFTKRNGTGGESIYGSPFPDEDLTRPLDKKGLLCMANKGPDTNGSQFFITLRECSHLNGKHVVFGRVLKGYNVVERLADVPVDERDRPIVPVIISNCGELELREKPSEKVAQEVAKSPKLSDSDIFDGSSRRRVRQKGGRTRERSPSSESDHPRFGKKAKHDEAPVKHDGMNIQHDRISETEEEYDARLEREEKDRLKQERKRDLERIKQQSAAEVHNGGVVRFKGRGRMKFVDPEIHHSRR